MNINKQERDKLRELAQKANEADSHYTADPDLRAFEKAATPDTILALLDMIDSPAASCDVRGFDAWARSEGLIQESHGIMFVSSMCGVARKAWQAASAERAPVVGLNTSELQKAVKDARDNLRTHLEKMYPKDSRVGVILKHGQVNPSYGTVLGHWHSDEVAVELDNAKERSRMRVRGISPGAIVWSNACDVAAANGDQK